jgi:hypothetical protein
MAYAMGYRSCAAPRLDLPKNALLTQSNHRRDPFARNHLACHFGEASSPLIDNLISILAVTTRLRRSRAFLLENIPRSPKNSRKSAASDTSQIHIS